MTLTDGELKLILTHLDALLRGGSPEFSAAELELIERLKFGAQWYYWCNGVLPGPWKDRFALIYHSCSGRAVKLEDTMHQAEKLLEASGIPYVWIKGADLAFSCYPAPSLRLSGDLDLLLPQDRCQEAMQLLDQAGWQCPVGCGNAHHYASRLLHGVELEPHFSLPNFGSVRPGELWEEITPAAPGSLRHRLSPELNLLMLYRHGGCVRWCRTNPLRFLLDFRLVLENSAVDWEKIRQLAERWELSSPAVVPAAFPEFFPPELRAPYPVAPEAADALRRILTSSLELEAADHQLAMADLFKGQRGWLALRMQSLRPEAMREKYPAARRGTLPLLGCYVRDLNVKFAHALNFFFRRRSPELDAHLDRIALIDTYRPKDK